MAEFKKPYDKAYGFWHVTTEGDCEGRSITDLGVFEGNIDTIALALADRCYYYTLYFTAVDPTAYDKTPKKDEINISIYGAFMKYKDRVEQIIVHCDAGYSRSPAVAAALAKALGMSDEVYFSSGQYCPNRHVYRMMMNELAARNFFD